MTGTLVLSMLCLLLGQATLMLDLGPRRLAVAGQRADVFARAGIVVAVASLVLWTPWVLALVTSSSSTWLPAWLWIHAAAGAAYFAYYLWAPMPGVVKRPTEVVAVACRCVPFPQGSAPPNPFHSARNTNLEVRRDRLSIPLGRDLRRPLAIGVVSDIHVHHSRDLPFVEWCIEQVNAFGADMIVALGDLTRRRKKVERTAEVVAHLRAPLGVFLVFGNHELHLGAEIATRAYGDRQVRVLRPEDGDVAVAEGLVLAASEWPFRRHDPLPQRQEGDCRLRVLLAHSPDNLLLAARAGFDLALSGHTHGGFPRVPGLGPLVAPLRCGRGLADGWFRRLDTWMFVTRGIGYVPASPFPRNPQVACVDVWLDPTGSERE